MRMPFEGQVDIISIGPNGSPRRKQQMKTAKPVLGLMGVGLFVLAACSTPTPEVIVVTATADQPAGATEAAPTEAPDDGLEPSFVVLISPANGTQWNVAQPIQVTGSARDVPSDTVLIFAIDGALNIIGQTTATLGPPNDEGIQAYAGTLSASVLKTTDGKIVSGVLNEDGSIAQSAGVFVTYVVPVQASITITEPADGSTIANPSSFTVSGTGQGLFENTVVVQATDSSGNVLAEVATTVNASEPGGAGSWSVTLSVDVPAETIGRIIAFSQDPSTGGTAASAQINVTYGQ